MKESGEPWLGQLPSHWACDAVKRHFAIQLGKMLQNNPEGPDDTETPYLKAQHVQWFSVRTSPALHMWASPQDLEHFGVSVGDLLVCEGGEGGRSGIVRSIPADFIIQNALHRVRPRGACLNEYLQYVMSTLAATGWLEAINNKATIAHFTRERFGAMRIPVPPVAEQAAIVRLLDGADRRIGRYIRDKQKLIELLHDQKQAIIHHAVTRGLDHNVTLKPSGVEWLGDVPRHWDIVRVKHVAKLESGHTPSRSNPLHWLNDNNIPWVSLNDTKALDASDYISDTKYRINELGLQNSSARILPAGVVVFTRDAAVGKAAITTRPMAVSQHLIAWVCGPRITNEYLLRVFYAMKPELARFTLGATIATIGMDDVGKLVTPVPPISEQINIAAFCAGATAELGDAIQRTKRTIERLREYRTRLMVEIVTGKLDVRTAGRLPEHAEESEPAYAIESESDSGEAGDELDAVPEDADA
jgi:type I restriction enzyme S subunit